MLPIKIRKLNNNATIPRYAHDGDSGLDLFTDSNIILRPKSNLLINTGIEIQLVYGYEAQVRSKSGLAIKENIRVFGGIGTIDPNYRGEILVHLENVGFRCYEFIKGDKIAQLVINKVEYANLILVDKLDRSNRNKEGFGSTNELYKKGAHFIENEIGYIHTCAYCRKAIGNPQDLYTNLNRDSILDFGNYYHINCYSIALQENKV